MTRFLVLASALWCFAPAHSASACDEPGTPTNLRARATSSTTIEVSYTNTAGNDETVRWDFEVANMGFDRENKDPKFQKFAQQGSLPPAIKGKGVPVSNTFTVKPGETRCYRVKAHLVGTNCVSKLPSNWHCATTPAPPPPKPTGVKEVPGAKVGQFLDPSIKVQRRVQDRFQITGDHFTPMKTVNILVSGKSTTGRSRDVKANGNGSFSALISGACDTGVQGDLAFTAQDSVKQPQKRVTATARCHSGVDPSGIKSKP